MMGRCSGIVAAATMVACVAKSPVSGPLPDGRVDRSQLPKPGPLEAWSPPVFEAWTLPSGLNVYHLYQNQAPLVSVRLVLPHGGAIDPPNKAGLTSLMADMLDEGAGGRSALDLSDALQHLATDVYAFVRTDGIEVGANMLASTADASMALFADVVRRPNFVSDEFERRKQQRVAEALSAEANPDYGRANVLRRAVFGDAYGSQPPNGHRAGLKEVTLVDVQNQYASVVQPRGAALVVVGLLTRKAAKKLVEKHFGDWRGAPAAVVPAPAASMPPRGIYLVDYPGAPQTGLNVVRLTAGHDAPDWAAGELFSWVLAEAFTSRLNLNLREDKGYTYGAYGYFRRFRGTGYYALSARVRTDATRASLNEMLRELQEVRGDRPITTEEYSAAQNGLRLGYVRRFESIAAISRTGTEIPLYNRPADWTRRWPESIGAVGPEAVRAVAQGLADPNGFNIVIAGDRSVVEPTLQDLGLPVFVFDSSGRPVNAPQAAY